MAHLSDIEIARAANKKPIQEIGEKLGIGTEHLLPYGHDKAKVSADFIAAQKDKPNGKLILVTAINPTPAGEGKTTTTVGLGDGLNAIGKKTAVCIREASLGSAMIDNHIYWGNALEIDSRRVAWRRVLDMNDRALRQITTSLGGATNGFPREAGFDITVASEVMAILCLANDLSDLEKRLGDIIVAYKRDLTPIYCRDIKADGAMTVLLKDAMQPNLVQTLENNPAFVHGGPFANIAHGCNSVVATKTAIVATVRAMKMNGGVAREDLGTENVDAVKKGCANLGRHIENVKSFGVPAVVAINHFVTDTDAEVAAVKTYVESLGSEAILCKHWAEGSKGTEALATRIVEIAESGAAQFSLLYPDDMPLFEKIQTIAKRIYRADEVLADKKIRDQLRQWEEAGYGNLPVCMAKTQYSFSTDQNLRGAPTGHSVPVREVRLSAGAGFVVVVCGEIMTMPGLPREPAAQVIKLNDAGEVEGLF